VSSFNATSGGSVVDNMQQEEQTNVLPDRRRGGECSETNGKEVPTSINITAPPVWQDVWRNDALL
jgi:hypothetical protein